jgi:hypothetical protein
MYFPTFDSLKQNAVFRQFRSPDENETESEYREAFADFMLFVDRVESAEIRSGAAGFNSMSAREKLEAMGVLRKKGEQ